MKTPWPSRSLKTTMPKLSLRDLFAVVTIVALALGWWVDRSRLAREKREMLGELLPLKMTTFRAQQQAEQLARTHAELLSSQQRALRENAAMRDVLAYDGISVWVTEDGDTMISESAKPPE